MKQEMKKFLITFGLLIFPLVSVAEEERVCGVYIESKKPIPIEEIKAIFDSKNCDKGDVLFIRATRVYPLGVAAHICEIDTIFGFGSAGIICNYRGSFREGDFTTGFDIDPLKWRLRQ